MERSGQHIAVIGGGPAGLFAAERLLAKGFSVALHDHMSSVGRKFIVAGTHGGLNITNNVPLPEFSRRYGDRAALFADFLADFSGTDLRTWLGGLGVESSVGSGGKVFPVDAEPAVILERWLSRLRSHPAFSLHTSSRWIGISPDGQPVFEPGIDSSSPAAVVLALGGMSWPATGSDGNWIALLAGRGIRVEPFQSANCGYETDWTPFQAARFTHVPLKNIVLSVADQSLRGELMLTPYGLEGGLVYALGSTIREEINRLGQCLVHLDLLPDWTMQKLTERWSSGPGKDSLSNYFRKKTGLGSEAFALVSALAGREELRTGDVMARMLKSLPIVLRRPRPVAEAISSAGGLSFDELDRDLMLRRLPGWFCAGEMLDWESPTGGFLMQGCFSTAHRAADGAERWLMGPGGG